jgi:asparagine synthase (glutamine-hydrolysing)
VCGIAGIVATAGVDLPALGRMSQAIEHRGPDGSAYLLHRTGLAVAGSLDARELESEAGATVGFAHRRLSIIDLSHASDQPIVDAGGRLALVYNGELYNYVELREALQREGQEFRTTGDSEVVLLAYKHWGERCVDRFVGMWAFAILDLDKRQVFLSRDRFGIKPLFYSVAPGAFRFASEIKGLLAGGEVHAEPNETAVRTFLLLGRADSTEESFFSGIQRLMPAHNAIVSLEQPERVRTTRYWSHPDEAYTGSLTDATEEFAELFADSVELHARADVAVGSCLSGGLDSSAIVCVAQELREQGKIPAYAHAGFGYVPQDASLSERKYMEAAAERADLRMTYVEAAPDRITDVIPIIARQQDEPFGTASIVVQWLVFEAAREAGLKVMLDGQGADEVLGGYHSYLTMSARIMLRQWQFMRYARFAAEHEHLHARRPLARRDAVATVVPGLRRLARGRFTPPPAAVGVMSADLHRGWQDVDDGAATPRSLNEILRRAGSVQLPALLRFEDRNSMAHSIEARVPFLDHRLVEFAFRLPGDYKIRGAQTKHILRRALDGTLPDAVRTRRDKVGFRPDPGVTWKFAELHRDSLLEARTPYEERWFDRAGLERLMTGADRSEGCEYALWRAISTKLWLRSHWAG